MPSPIWHIVTWVFKMFFKSLLFFLFGGFYYLVYQTTKFSIFSTQSYRYYDIKIKKTEYLSLSPPLSKGKIMICRQGWMRCLFWMFNFNDINRDQFCLVGCFVLKTVYKISNFPSDVQHDFLSAYIKSMLQKRNILLSSSYAKIMYNSMRFSQLSALLTKEEIHFQRD